MIRDYWIYQKRQSKTHQWAIYVVKEWQRGYPEATVLDFTFYSEDIGNATNSISFVGWHYPYAMGYVDSLIAEMVEYTEITAQDKEQLETEISRILFDS